MGKFSCQRCIVRTMLTGKVEEAITSKSFALG